MDKKSHLTQVYNSFLGDEKMVKEKIKDPENKSYFIPPLEGTNLTYAIYSLYIENNIEKAKIYFYRAASVAEYAIVQFDRRSLFLKTISYALLSDDKELINRYSSIQNQVFDETNISYQLTNSIQNILIGNWGKLDRNIRWLERFVKNPKCVSWNGIVNVLTGFKEKDANQIKLGLEELLATTKQRAEGDPLIYKFISIEVAGLTKLAWIKNYEIDLKSELVPMEMMPIKPLENYGIYEFLISN